MAVATDTRYMESQVALAFDTLGYAKRLRDGGVSPDQAEAHAEAARDFIMIELATKTDLLAVQADLKAAIAQLETKLEAKIAHLDLKFDTKIDNLSLRLTVRLGVMLAAGIAVLGALLRLG
jgi:hypothetical protein